jgi:hypothetical protein
MTRGDVMMVYDRDRRRKLFYKQKPEPRLTKSMSLTVDGGKIGLKIGVKDKSDYSQPDFTEQMKRVGGQHGYFARLQVPTTRIFHRMGAHVPRRLRGCGPGHPQSPTMRDSVKGGRSKRNDDNIKGLARDFDMTNIKSTREGEAQDGYLTRNNAP